MALCKEHLDLIVGNILEESADGDVVECKEAVKDVIKFMREDWEMPKLTQQDNEAIWKKVSKAFTSSKTNSYYTVSFIKGTRQALKIKTPLVITV